MSLRSVTVYNCCKVCVIDVLIVLMLSLFCSPLVAADWPNWRGPDHNGISTENDWLQNWPEQGPKILWRQSVGTGFSSITVADGRAYTMGNSSDNDTVFCFDALTGKELWKHTYAEPLTSGFYEGGPSATPTVDQGRVYTYSKTGKVFCLDAATGKVVWDKDLAKVFGIEMPRWGLAGSAVVVGDMVIFNAGTWGLALEKTNGELKWQSGTGAAGYASAVPFSIDGKDYVIMFSEKDLAIINIVSGRKIWEFPWPTKNGVNAADPIVSKNRIFISSGYGTGCALLEVKNGPIREVWRNKEMRNHFNSCVLIGGYVYGFDEKVLRCLDFETGTVKWSEDGLGKGSLTAADDKLIILSEDGRLVIAPASQEAFTVIAEASILSEKCWTVPVLANALIYARDAKGNMVCVDVRKTTPVDQTNAPTGP